MGKNSLYFVYLCGIAIEWLLFLSNRITQMGKIYEQRQ